MRILFKKTSLLFWILIPIILFFSFLNTDSTLDVNVHDTYFVIGHFQLGILASIFFGLIGLIYWILEKFNRKRVKWITLAHIILTIGGIVIIAVSNTIVDTDKFYTNSKYAYYDSLVTINVVIAISLLIVLCSQLLLLINFLIGILSKEKLS